MTRWLALISMRAPPRIKGVMARQKNRMAEQNRPRNDAAGASLVANRRRMNAVGDNVAIEWASK